MKEMEGRNKGDTKNIYPRGERIGMLRSFPRQNLMEESTDPTDELSLPGRRRSKNMPPNYYFKQQRLFCLYQ